MVNGRVIVCVKKTKPGSYKVDVYTRYAQPLTSYTNITTVYLDEKPLADFEELHVEALLVKYIKEKGEVYIYTKTP